MVSNSLKNNSAQTIQESMSLFYFQVVDIWKRLCESHNILLSQTFEEYKHLLDGKITDVEEIVSKKQETIFTINHLDDIRRELIENINIFLNQHNISSKVHNVGDLIQLMKNFEIERGEKHLQSFNAFLIDIIEKIQVQNKKNQQFLNRAIISLKEMREDAVGEKKYHTYTPKGSATSNTTNRYQTIKKTDGPSIREGQIE